MEIAGESHAGHHQGHSIADHLPPQVGDFMKQLKKSKRPVILTVKGQAAAIVQDAGAYQRLLDIAARVDVYEAISQGLDDSAQGRTRPATAVFDDLRRRHDIPR